MSFVYTAAWDKPTLLLLLLLLKSTSVWKHANKLTKNGCRILFAVKNILFSDKRLKESN